MVVVVVVVVAVVAVVAVAVVGIPHSSKHWLTIASKNWKILIDKCENFH